MSNQSEELKLNPLNRPVLGKEACELGAELRTDERAARVRDGMTEFSAEMEAIAVPPNYDEFRKEATEAALSRMQGEPIPDYQQMLRDAVRSWNPEIGKDGPER
jgi:hypothetical protein